jgi:hypothetical protein
VYQILNSKMFFFNHILSSSRDNDVELHDLESGERSGNIAIYPPLPLEPFNSQMGVGGRPANISTSPTPQASMQIETSGGSMQLSPAEVGMQSDPNPKRSRYWDQANSDKVRIIAQTSRIPTVVSAVTCHMK